MAHLWSWAEEPWPVILVRYDAAADRGYWQLRSDATTCGATGQLSPQQNPPFQAGRSTGCRALLAAVTIP